MWNIVFFSGGDYDEQWLVGNIVPSRKSPDKSTASNFEQYRESITIGHCYDGIEFSGFSLYSTTRV